MKKNTTVIFPAPLMSAIGELSAFLARQSTATKSTQVAGNGLPAVIAEN